MHTQRIPAWLDSQECHADIPHFERLLERVQGSIVFAQPEPRQGTMNGWNVPPFIHLFQLSQHALCLRAIPLSSKGMPAKGQLAKMFVGLLLEGQRSVSCPGLEDIIPQFACSLYHLPAYPFNF